MIRSDPIYDGLNPAQREAVAYGAGPLMVLAGAGSGKTRVITRRIARLLRDGARPSSILALTFTNKAAGEMAKRVRELGGDWVRVATFHSACARFLREDGALLGYPRDFSIYDTYDRDSALKMLMQDKGLGDLGVRPAQLGRRISQLKNAGMSPDDLILGRGTVDQCVDACFRDYQQLLLDNGALDFDDLLGKFVELLRKFPAAAERYQQRFEWVLVDEFQDTNGVQYDLLRRLVAGYRNLCVVGDPDQSIYRFRGADIRNILDFEHDFPETVTVRLEQNYRSSACILRAAESVISHNQQRKDKRLVTQADEGDQIVFFRALGSSQEAREVAERVESMIFGDVDPEEIAVFYRSHFLSRGFEEAFRARGIPYRIIGGLTFFERREVKDLLAYLRAIVNPLDDVSMARIVNVPPRGIGKVTLTKMRDIGAAAGASLSEVVVDAELRGQLPSRARAAMATLAEVLEAARELGETSAYEALSSVCEAIDYVEHIGGLGDPEDVSRQENVAELHSDAKQFDREIGGGLAEYLQHVSLLTSESRAAAGSLANQDLPRVSMMTVHAAKGLEFDHVFVAGLEESLFPHIRSLEDADGSMEEERRLMYVALTRARRNVWLGSSRTRMVNGRTELQSVSSFIDEIDPSCLVRVDSSAGEHTDRPGRFGFGDGLDDSMDGAGGSGFVFEADPGLEPDFSQIEVELNQGTRVVHAVYGQGMILEVRGQGPQMKVRVQFEKVGERLLVVEHAGLQVVPTEQGY